MGVVRAVYPPVLVSLAFLLLSTLSLWFCLGALVMVIDAVARHSEYKLLRSDYKHKHRYALLMRSSWCGRAAAVAALPEMKFIFHKRGYRWYHILPDGFPLVFTKIDFWFSVLGINRIINKNK